MSSGTRCIGCALALLLLPQAVRSQVTTYTHWFESSPPARIGGFAAYDSVSDNVLLLGGGFDTRGPAFSPVPSWELSLGAGGTWRRREWQIDPYLWLTHATFDPNRREIWLLRDLYPNFVFRLEATSNAEPDWVPALYVDSPPYMHALAIAYDGPRDRLVLLARTQSFTSSDTLLLFEAPIADTLEFARIEMRGAPLAGLEPDVILWDQQKTAFVLPYVRVSAGETSPVYTLAVGADPHWEAELPDADPTARVPLPDFTGTSVVQDQATSDLYLVISGFAWQELRYRAELWKLERSPTLRWTRLPAPVELARMGSLALDSRRRRLVYHGGFPPRDGFPPSTLTAVSTTRYFDIAAGSWAAIEPESEPEPRSGYAIAYDHARDRALMFGGTEFRTNSTLQDLWARTSRDGAWHRLELKEPLPRHRSGAFLVEDRGRSRFLLLGGWIRTAQGTEPAHDAWQLSADGDMAWAPITTTGTPPDRVDGVLLDAARDRLVIHGAVSQPFETGEWELSLGETPHWRRLPVAGTSSLPQLCGFALDLARDRALIFGGYPSFSGTTIEFGSLWGFSLGSDSVRVERLSHPNFTEWFSSLANTGGIAVDPVRDRLFAFGGTGEPAGPSFGPIPSSVAATVTLANGPAGWVRFEPSTGGPPATSRPIVYDPIRDSFWFFGGGDIAGSSSVFEWEGGYQGWPQVEARATTTPEPAVLLEWSAPSGLHEVAVMRRAAGEAWRFVGGAIRGDDGMLRFTDAPIAPRQELHYRLAWPVPGGDIPVGEVSVTTQDRGIAAVRVRQNPAVGTIAMDLDLPKAGAVQVQLLDLAGRLVAEERFAASVAGRRPFDLGRLDRLDPGLYFVRVTSPAGIVTARVTFLR